MKPSPNCPMRSFLGFPIAMALLLGMGLCPVQADAQTALEFNDSGIEAYNAGRYEEAIDYFEQAYIVAPDNEVALQNYTNALRAGADNLAKQEQLEAAMGYLETALQVEPENFAAHLQLGSYHLKKNQVSQAIDRLEAAVELQPGHLDAHDLLGQAYYLDNDLPSARAQWEYVLQMDPDRSDLQERYDKAFREERVEADFNRRTSRHFQINYPHSIPTHTRSTILTILEHTYLDIGRRFGGVYPESPIHVIIYTAEQFSEATEMESHVGAIYDGKIRIPLTDEHKNYLTKEELKRRLVHEYVHVVVREIAGDQAPWWLNEGLAETLSTSLDQQQLRTLANAYQNEALLSFHNLENHQLKALPPEPLRIAYLQSHAAVNMLWRQHGGRRMQLMLEDISKGIAPEESLQYHYRKNYDNLERALAAQYAN